MDNINEFIERFRNEFIDAEDLNIKPESSFRDLPTWDSLTSMSILLMIKEVYDIEITISDLKNCDLVSDIYKIISEKSNKE